jgi:hypothetical protein
MNEREQHNGVVEKVFHSLLIMLQKHQEKSDKNELHARLIRIIVWRLD